MSLQKLESNDLLGGIHPQPIFGSLLLQRLFLFMKSFGALVSNIEHPSPPSSPDSSFQRRSSSSLRLLPSPAASKENVVAGNGKRRKGGERRKRRRRFKSIGWYGGEEKKAWMVRRKGKWERKKDLPPRGSAFKSVKSVKSNKHVHFK